MQMTLPQVQTLASKGDSLPVQSREWRTSAQAEGLHREKVIKTSKLFVEDLKHLRKACKIYSKGPESH